MVEKLNIGKVRDMSNVEALSLHRQKEEYRIQRKFACIKSIVSSGVEKGLIFFHAPLPISPTALNLLVNEISDNIIKELKRETR